MCILFLSAGELARKNGYRLILANNRDEFYARKTGISEWRHISDPSSNNTLDVLDDCSKATAIIGGTDLQEGKEGGTWLSMSRKGRLAVLLNVFQGNRKIEEKSNSVGGRGFLVNDYLLCRSSATEYLREIELRKQEFMPFHLVTLDLSGNETEVCHYCNQSDSSPRKVKGDLIAVGNNFPWKSWRKVDYGKSVFENILQRGLSGESLIEELLQMLSNDERHFPDEELIDQGGGFDENILKCLSSIFVTVKPISYGTRTQTVILVDTSNKVTFVERTINCQKPFSSIKDADFATVTFQFSIE